MPKTILDATPRFARNKSLRQIFSGGPKGELSRRYKCNLGVAPEFQRVHKSKGSKKAMVVRPFSAVTDRPFVPLV